MSLYAIARIYVVEGSNAREAYEWFPELVRRDEHGRAAAEYQSNCWPITREQADSPDWHVETLHYGNEPLGEPIPATDEEER